MRAEVELEFEYSKDPAIQDLNGLLWLASSEEGRAIIAEEMGLPSNATQADVLAVMNQYAGGAETFERTSALWLDDDYLLEWPSEGWIEAQADPDAWREWLAQVTVRSVFLDVFRDDLSGEVFLDDFEDPLFHLDALEEKGYFYSYTQNKVRAAILSEQKFSWIMAPDHGLPATLMNWYYPQSGYWIRNQYLEWAPRLTEYDVWIGEFRAYREERVPGPDAVAAEIPLAGGGLVYLSTIEADFDFQSMVDVREKMQSQLIELQLPRSGIFPNEKTTNKDFDSPWSGSLETDDFSGLICSEGTMLQAGYARTSINWGVGEIKFQTWGALLFSLIDPPMSPSWPTTDMDGDIGAEIENVDLRDRPFWRASATDFFFNRPFVWALLGPTGNLLASGVHRDFGLLTSTIPTGWHQSIWFGWFYREPERSSFFGLTTIGEEGQDSAIWTYHADHGWLYLDELKASGSFYWDQGLQAWVWASARTYPWLYLDGEGWVYFLDEAEGRWFFSASTENWRFVAD
jgi:hypothetical protein